MKSVFCTARTRVLAGVQIYFTLKVHQPINQQKQALVPHRKDTNLSFGFSESGLKAQCSS